MSALRLNWHQRQGGDPGRRAAVTPIVERALIGEYRELVAEALDGLDGDTHAACTALCELPDVIRGYEDVKPRNVARFRERAAQLRAVSSPRRPGS